MPLSRRQLLQSTAATAVTAVLPATARATQPPPARRPIVIASGNGLAACTRAMERLRAGDDALDAVIAGVNLVEDDPEDTSVGYGGLPNERGVVQLDACCMHGPTHKAGGVACLEGIRFPSRVARLVMQRTDHCLIVGQGAQDFAVAHGFEVENLLTDKARRIWLEWKENNSVNDDWLGEKERQAAGRWDHESPAFTYGTINCCAVDANGNLSGVTTTSGLAYKIPGRVGDSPIIGAGLYVDNEVGAAGSTGRGEANLQNLTSYQVVEFMRSGLDPQEACLAAMKRVADRTERRLRNDRDEPGYGLRLYAVARDGRAGGAIMRGKGHMACHDGTEAKQIPLAPLY